MKPKTLQWINNSKTHYPMSGTPEFMCYDYTGFIIHNGQPVNLVRIKHDSDAVYEKINGSMKLITPHYYRGVFLTDELFLAHLSQEKMENGEGLEWAQECLDSFTNALFEII